MTGDRVLATTAEILRRPTEYFRILRKHRGGRQSTRCYSKEYSHGRQDTLCCRIEHYDGRQSTLYNCGNTTTADRVLPHFAQASWRPTEYSKCLLQIIGTIGKSFFLFFVFSFLFVKTFRKTLLAGQSLGSLNFTLTSTSSISSSIRNLSR